MTQHKPETDKWLRLGQLQDPLKKTTELPD